jgi:hypothetical protein
MSDEPTNAIEQSSLTLTDTELFDLTHYRRPAEQLRELESLGIPAKRRRHDNTVCVLRIHLLNPGMQKPAAPRPQLRTRAK